MFEKYFHTPQNHRSLLLLWFLPSERHFEALTVKLSQPHYDPKDGRFAKFYHTPLNHRFHLVIWCLSSERHFVAVSVKFSLNCITKRWPICKTLSDASFSLYAITTKKIANFQNSFTCLGIIAFMLFGALDHSQILELLRWNSPWTVLLPKR